MCSESIQRSFKFRKLENSDFFSNQTSQVTALHPVTKKMDSVSREFAILFGWDPWLFLPVRLPNVKALSRSEPPCEISTVVVTTIATVERMNQFHAEILMWRQNDSKLPLRIEMAQVLCKLACDLKSWIRFKCFLLSLTESRVSRLQISESLSKWLAFCVWIWRGFTRICGCAKEVPYN